VLQGIARLAIRAPRRIIVTALFALVGAAVFGIGWGIGGYCPGPAVTALASLSTGTLVFVAAMIAGGILARIAPSIRQGT